MSYKESKAIYFHQFVLFHSFILLHMVLFLHRRFNTSHSFEKHLQRQFTEYIHHSCGNIQIPFSELVYIILYERKHSLQIWVIILFENFMNFEENVESFQNTKVFGHLDENKNINRVHFSLFNLFFSIWNTLTQIRCFSTSM